MSDQISRHLNATEADQYRIKSLLEEYANAIDAQDKVRLKNCFTDDAFLQYDTKPHIFERPEKFVEFASGLSQFITSHTICNAEIKVNGDSATAFSRFTALLFKDGSVTARSGTYEDVLVRSSDGWRISRRVHTPHFQFNCAAVQL